MKTPDIGLLICNSGSSNSGALTGIASVEVVKELGSNMIGILSLPALANQIPRQIFLAKKLKYLLVIDGCSNSCAKKILEKAGLTCTEYLNLENDLDIEKSGPFSTLEYDFESLNKVKDAIKKRISMMQQVSMNRTKGV